MFTNLPKKAKQSLLSSGKETVEEIGDEIVRDVVRGVLLGKNVRDSTELLTRAKLNSLYAAVLYAYLQSVGNEGVRGMTRSAAEKLGGRLSRAEKTVLPWILGLTGKGIQNILRDDTSNLKQYTDDYMQIFDEGIEEFSEEYGELKGSIKLGDQSEINLDWDLMLQLMAIVGAQTLTVRGSDKSKFGKLYEGLILGSLLTVLGFEHVPVGQIGEGVFWLSERRDKRESDATLLLKGDNLVRFDIGFIGRGNSEISLDKVSRYERKVELGGGIKYASTIVIVDRIGAKSRIVEMAQEINGEIIQMAQPDWVLSVAKIINNKFNTELEILNVGDLEGYINKHLKEIDFKSLV